MESSGSLAGHLDATQGREVVFCHPCAIEWFRDERGIRCPNCSGEFTEIIDPENDPRVEEPRHSSASTSPELRPARFPLSDSDPDEADINELDEPPYGAHSSEHHGNRHEGEQMPGQDPVFRRFIEMIDQFQGRTQPQSATNPFRARTTTYTTRTANGATTHVTIFSGRGHPARGLDDSDDDEDGADRPDDPFEAFLRDALREQHTGPGQTAHFERRDAFPLNMQSFWRLLAPPGVAVGDIATSQTHLDEIITRLMESNAPSGAPPASQQALASLPRKVADQALLDSCSDTACSICIDDISVGETVLYLPCKHWFHDECVMLWLKEHNTCPVCRSPIESARDADTSGSNTEPSDEANASGSSMPTRNEPFANWFGSFNRDPGGPPPSSVQHTTVSSSEQGRTSRPSVVHSSSDTAAQRSSFAFDTSAFQHRRNRNSHSPPPATRYASPAEQAGRIRVRSPSRGSPRLEDRDELARSSGSDTDRTSSTRQSTGPLGWLRNRFSGNNGTGSSSRDGSSTRDSGTRR